MSSLIRIPRGEKAIISKGISDQLQERKAKGPPEAATDAFIDELDAVTKQLETHVNGKADSIGARSKLDDELDLADDNVDTWARHLDGYLFAESLRRRGDYAEAARKLHEAAFPKGLAPINEYVVDQNVYFRATLNTLRADEAKATLAAIGLPAAWLDGFEAALKASDATMAELIKTRGAESHHVGMGRNAEEAWVDLMVRLRRQVANRAKKGDRVKQLENKLLLEPLLAALEKQDAEKAARATRKKKQQPAAEPAQGSSGKQPAPAPAPAPASTPAPASAKPSSERVAESA